MEVELKGVMREKPKVSSNEDVEVGVSNTDPVEEVPLLQRAEAEKMGTIDVQVVTIDEKRKTKYPENRRASLRKFEFGKVVQEIQAKVTTKRTVGPKGIYFLPKN